MNHDLIDTENLTVGFRLLLLSVSGNVLPGKPGFIDILDDIPPNASDLR